jgi:hypothetical protein
MKLPKCIHPFNKQSSVNRYSTRWSGAQMKNITDSYVHGLVGDMDKG